MKSGFIKNQTIWLVLLIVYSGSIAPLGSVDDCVFYPIESNGRFEKDSISTNSLKTASPDYSTCFGFIGTESSIKGREPETPFTGTGILIGKRFFLTAAHNLMHLPGRFLYRPSEVESHSKKEAQQAASLEKLSTPIPVSAISIYFPLNRLTIRHPQIVGFYVSNAYPRNISSDMALVVFNQDIEVDGVALDKLGNNENTNIANGEPVLYTYVNTADKKSHQSDILEKVALRFVGLGGIKNQFVYIAPVAGYLLQEGDSGCGVCYQKNNTTYLLGIYVMQVELESKQTANVLVFFTQNKIALLSKWMELSTNLTREKRFAKITLDMGVQGVHVQRVSAGRDFIAISQDSVIGLYIAQNPSRHRVRLGHRGIINCMDFSPKMDLLIVGDNLGYIYVWSSLQSGQPKGAAYLDGSREVRSLSHNVTGDLLAVSVYTTQGQEQIQTWGVNGSTLTMLNKHILSIPIDILYRDPRNASIFFVGNAHGIGRAILDDTKLSLLKLSGVSGNNKVSSQFDFAFSHCFTCLGIITKNEVSFFHGMNISTASYEPLQPPKERQKDLIGVSSIASDPTNKYCFALGTSDGKIRIMLITPDPKDPKFDPLSVPSIEAKSPIICLMYTLGGRLVWMNSNYDLHIW